MRNARLLAFLLVLNFMTASMGLPLLGEGGKFSASNIMPVVFVLMAGLLFFRAREHVDRRLVAAFLAFNLACCLSFVIFLVRYAWDPNFAVLFFQDVELIFCALLWWFARENPDEFRSAVRTGIYCSIPVYLAFAFYDRHTEAPWFSFGMDDKSHSAVLMSCEAYVLIRFFGGKLDRLVALGLYVATYLTISRLPVFFLPAIILASMRGSRYAPAVTTVMTIAVAVIVATYGDALSTVFVVYDRLSSVETVTGSDSTAAHVLLLKTALQIKFTDPWAFIFGTGPGNFSKALSSFPVSIAEIQALDPQLVAFAQQGRAPLHSMPMQMLLDYPFVVFLLFVFYVLRALRWLLRRRVLADTVFFLGFLAAATFYSLHNKPYFYLVVIAVSVLMVQARPLARLAPGDADEGPGDAYQHAGKQADGRPQGSLG
jgi:hypothetical protein